jgi:hypothetical protein
VLAEFVPKRCPFRTGPSSNVCGADASCFPKTPADDYIRSINNEAINVSNRDTLFRDRDNPVAQRRPLDPVPPGDLACRDSSGLGELACDKKIAPAQTDTSNRAVDTFAQRKSICPIPARNISRRNASSLRKNSSNVKIVAIARGCCNMVKSASLDPTTHLRPHSRFPLSDILGGEGRGGYELGT